MEPIQPVHLGGSSNLGGITNVAQGGAPTPIGAGQIQSVTNVGVAVSNMLQSIGGGVENDQMLKALIALMIIAALLQQTTEGGKSSSESLRALGNGRGEAVQGMATNASFVSIEHTSISINSTSISQTNGGFDGGGQLGGELDIAS